MRIARLTCAVQQSGARGPVSIVAFDGDAWTRPVPIAGSSVTTPPALARFGEALWCLHQDAQTTGNLVALTFDGARWSDEAVVVPQAMTAAPAAAVLGGRLYVANQGYHASHTLSFASTDGRSWTPATPSGVTSKLAASTEAATFGELLYVFYNQLGPIIGPVGYAALSSAGRWSAESLVPGIVTLAANTPGAAVFEERLHVLCALPGKQLSWASFDGARWEAAQTLSVASGQVTGGVSAVAFEGLLYVLFRSSAGTLAYVTYDGTTWNGPGSAGAFTIAGEPAAAVF